jgi:hypothetical protein
MLASYTAGRSFQFNSCLTVTPANEKTSWLLTSEFPVDDTQTIACSHFLEKSDGNGSKHVMVKKEKKTE